MLKYSAIVIRQLPNHDPHVAAVIDLPRDLQRDDMTRADAIKILAPITDKFISKFKETFVEFYKADFYVDYVEMSTLLYPQIHNLD